MSFNNGTLRDENNINILGDFRLTVGVNNFRPGFPSKKVDTEVFCSVASAKCAIPGKPFHYLVDRYKNGSSHNHS